MAGARKLLRLAVLGLTCWLGEGCSRIENAHEKAVETGVAAPAKPAAQETVQELSLTGEVKKVDAASREITIRHDAIPGFMDAMTMPFRLEKEADPDDFRAGDRVEGRLRVERENGQVREYQLLDLTVTTPATPAPLVLDLSGGAPRLAPAARRLAPGEPVPDIRLTGEDGKSFKLSDLRGHVVVLTFIYTRCPLPDFCPLMDRKFQDLARSLEVSPKQASKVRLLSISFDPEHDTPEVLRKHAQIRGASAPLWTYAVASHEELGRVMAPLGLVYGPGKNEIIHNLCTAVVDPEGKLARLEVGTQSNKWSTADLLKTIQGLTGGPRK